MYVGDVSVVPGENELQGERQHMYMCGFDEYSAYIRLQALHHVL